MQKKKLTAYYIVYLSTQYHMPNSLLIFFFHSYIRLRNSGSAAVKCYITRYVYGWKLFTVPFLRDWMLRSLRAFVHAWMILIHLFSVNSTDCRMKPQMNKKNEISIAIKQVQSISCASILNFCYRFYWHIGKTQLDRHLDDYSPERVFGFRFQFAPFNWFDWFIFVVVAYTIMGSKISGWID